MSERLKLTDREWGEFVVRELFDVFTGANIPKRELSEGTIPRITATDENNGIESYTLPVDQNKSYRTNEKCVSLSFLGSVFYQSYKASYDMKIHSLRLRGDKPIPSYIGLFLSTELRKQCSKFSYGNQLSSTDLPKQKLILPIAKSGLPDWAFMEAYMKQVEEQLLSEALPRLEQQLLEQIILLGALEGREWGEFVLGELFDIYSTSSSIDKKRLNGLEGNIPYVTRSESNNGIDSFIGQQPNFPMDEANVITIGLDTQTVFYQSSPFYTGQNIQVVRHPNLNKYNALFVIRAISVLVKKFSWGSYGATLTRLRKGKIFLPIQADGTPDWAFMSDFMKKIEQDTLSKALEFFKLRKSKQMLTGGGKMKHFFMEDILYIANGVRLTKADMATGKRPFVGASESNNGVTTFVANINGSLDQGVLGVNYNGSVGFSFYHPYEALFSDDVKRVRWKNRAANNQYTLLYLSAAIAQQRGKYAYGYKFNAQRMKRQIIMLPAKADGAPDYAYMEQTMRAMEFEVLMTYLTHHANRPNA